MNKLAQLSPVPLGFGAYVLSLLGFLQLGLLVHAAAVGDSTGLLIGLGVGMLVAFAFSAAGFRIQALQSGGVLGGAFLDTWVAGERERSNAVAAPTEPAGVVDVVGVRERVVGGKLPVRPAA